MNESVTDGSGANLQPAAGRNLLSLLRIRLESDWPLVRARYIACLTPHRLLMGVLLAVGFYLRIHFALGLDYFQDEIDLQQTALFGDLSPQGLPFPGIVHGLFMALAHSTSGLALRLPSILFGTACIPALYVLGRTAYGRTAGLYASVFLTISPIAIFSSAEGRPYGMFQFFVILTLIGFLRMERGTARDGVYYAVSLCLCTLTHLLTAQLLLGLGAATLVWFALDRDSNRLIKIGLYTAAGCFLPVVALIGRPLVRDSGITHFHQPFWYLIERSLSALTYSFYPSRAPTFLSEKGGWVFGAVALMPLTNPFFARRRHVTLTFLLVFFVSMLVTFQTLGDMIRWEWWPRYIYHCMPPLLVLIGGGLDEISIRFPRLPRWIPFAAALILFRLFTPALPRKQMPSPIDEGGRSVAMADAIESERARLKGIIIPDDCIFIPVRRIVAIYAGVKEDVLPIYATVRWRAVGSQHEEPFVNGGLHPVIYRPARYGLGLHAKIAERRVDRFPPGTYPIVQYRWGGSIGCDAIERMTGGHNLAVMNRDLSARMNMVVCDVTKTDPRRPAPVRSAPR